MTKRPKKAVEYPDDQQCKNCAAFLKIRIGPYEAFGKCGHPESVDHYGHLLGFEHPACEVFAPLKRNP